MSKDDQQESAVDRDRTEADALDATEELSDDALDGVAGGYMPVKNFTSPFEQG